MENSVKSPLLIMKRSKRVLDFDTDGKPIHPLWNAFTNATKRRERKLWMWGANFNSIAILLCNQHILLAQKETGEWVLPGGFNKRNETPETCVMRELCEEVFSQHKKKAMQILKSITPKIVYSNLNNFDANTSKHFWIEANVLKFVVPKDKFEELTKISSGSDDITRSHWFHITKLPAKISPFHMIMIAKNLRQ